MRAPPPLETVSQYAAVALFIDRAQAVKPDFIITNESAPDVSGLSTGRKKGAYVEVLATQW
jgi:predicted ATPase